MGTYWALEFIQGDQKYVTPLIQTAISVDEIRLIPHALLAMEMCEAGITM